MPEANHTVGFTNDGSVYKAPAGDVWTRERWSEPWKLRPGLNVNNAVWSVAPGTSTAELSWNYGKVTRSNIPVVDLVPPDDGHQRYVRISWLGTERRWYGIVNGVGTRAGGTQIGPLGLSETGHQTIHCVGLEKLLDEQPIRFSAWYSHELQSRQFSARGFTFNALRADGTPGGNMENAPNWSDGVPLYSGKVRDDDMFWTTPDILQYLVKYHRPADHIFAEELPIGLDPDFYDVAISFDHDRPTLDTHGRTLRQLFDQLLPHQRFVTWYVDVVDELNAIMIKLVSLSGDPILLPSGDVIQANTRRLHVNLDTSTSSVFRVLSHADAVERVRIQGALRTSTFSVSHADGSLKEGYTAEQKAAWDIGATGTAAYIAAGANTAIKNKLNEEVRSRDALREVYSHFKIPDNWNGIAKNGEGSFGAPFYRPFTTDLEAYFPAHFYQRELYLEPYLTLRDGYDYRTLTDVGGNRVAPAQISKGPHNLLPPLVVFKIPASGAEAARLAAVPRWRHAERIASEVETVPGDAANQWSAHVTIANQDRAIVVNVDGHKQYIIAGTDYTKKSYEDKYTAWTWKEMIATISVKCDEYCEGVWPELVDLPAKDYIREALFSAGDAYRLDYLVPNTVIALDINGELVRSEGGWIQDDRQKLEDRARLAFGWYGVSRQAIQFSTGQINNSVKLGDYIVSVGNAVTHSINTVVTSIRIDCDGAGIGGVPGIPTISYTTDWIPDIELFLSPSLETTKRTTLRRMSNQVDTQPVSGQTPFSSEMGKQRFNPTRLIPDADHGRTTGRMEAP